MNDPKRIDIDANADCYQYKNHASISSRDVL